MSIKIALLDEVRELMDQMMDVPILPVSEKRRMLMDDSKTLLDPNLIMDARHNIFREAMPLSPAKCSILSEARRLLTDEEISELNWKKEQDFLERELRKFEKELERTRPKFGKAYNCSRKNFATSDDDEFWRTSSRVRVKSYNVKQTILTNDTKSNGRTTCTTMSKNSRKLLENWSTPLDVMKENEEPCLSNIKVTITDKPSPDIEEQRLDTLRMAFDILMQNAKEERRLRDVESRVQRLLALKRLRHSFATWRSIVEQRRKTKLEEMAKSSTETDVKKIEILVGVISEKQKELVKARRSEKEVKSEVAAPTDVEVKNRRKIYGKHVIFDPSPAQCRLIAQKAIIEKQKMKLAEQDRLIEEMRLKQVQEEIARANSDTVNVAKETLTNCGQKTRRTLIQLMRQAGYRMRSLEGAQQLPEPPKFLARMEARAVARRERIRIAEAERRKKLEEQKRQEEEARQREEQEKRRAQREVLLKAKRLREEQERHRAREMEKFEKLNEMANNFYRKYLLRRYIMDPFYSLLEMRDNRIETANAHYRMTLMRKIFTALYDETEKHRRIKIELATSTYNRNITWYIFREWRNVTKESRQKYQVAKDLHDLRLLEKSFKTWKTVCLALKAEQSRNEQLAMEHYVKSLCAKYLKRWKKYSEIAGEIKEIESRKDRWRQIVQQVIPDFHPKHRGVALDD